MGNRPKTLAFPKRGEVYMVDFDPTRGSEMAKCRPAVIIQNDIGNRYAATTIVAPFTSQFDETLYPTEVLVRAPEGGLASDSVVRLDQVRVTDKARLLRRLGILAPVTIRQVNSALLISLGLGLVE